MARLPAARRCSRISAVCHSPIAVYYCAFLLRQLKDHAEGSDMAATGAARVSALTVFRNGNFARIWSAQFVSTASRALVQLAAGYYVFQLSGSALDVGLMLVATTAPSLLFGLVAGVFVDRLDRRRVLIGAEFARAILALAIPLLLHSSVAWLYVITFLISTAAQFFEPAVGAILPEMATEEELTAANSVFVVSSIGAMSAGFVIGGLLMAWLPIQAVFVVAALGFFASMLLIYSAHLPGLIAQGRTTAAAVAQNLASGIRSIGHSTTLRWLFFVFIPIFWLMGISFALVLPFSVGDLGATQSQYGLMEASPYIGVSLGALAMASVAQRLRDGVWLALSVLTQGVAIVLMAMSHQILLAGAFFFAYGFLSAPSIVARSTIIQRQTAREMRGRVFSAFFVMRDTLFMLGSLSAGLADLYGPRAIFMAIGVGWVVCGAIILVLPGLGRASSTWRRGEVALTPGFAGAALGALSAPRPASTLDLDLLIAHLPVLARCAPTVREHLIQNASVRSALSGAPIVRRGDDGDSAWFILEGSIVAGIQDESGTTRVLEIMNEGDFFGEIAALTGVPRTANVSALTDSLLLEVPGDHLRAMAADPDMDALFTSQMNARLARSRLVAAGHFGDKDQDALLDLRTPQPAGPARTELAALPAS